LETNAGGLRASMLLLGVDDLERSVAFYERLLGFAQRGRADGLAFLDAGSLTLGLSTGLGSARPQRGGEAVELVLACAGLQAERDRLAAAGVEIMIEPRLIDGTNHVFNIADPDGHILSFFGAL